MSSAVHVASSEVVNVQGAAIKNPFFTTKRAPISVVCGLCNTRCPTELVDLPVQCMQPARSLHNCSNCGAHIATVGAGGKIPVQSCTLF